MTYSKDSDIYLDKLVNCSPKRIIDKIDDTIQFSCAIPEAIYQFYVLAAKKIYHTIKTNKYSKDQKS